MKRLLMLFLTGLCAVSLQLNAQTSPTVATDGGVTPPTDETMTPAAVSSGTQQSKDAKDTEKEKDEEQRKSVAPFGSYPNAATNSVPTTYLNPSVSNPTANAASEANLSVFAGSLLYPSPNPLGTQTLLGTTNAFTTSVNATGSYPNGYATNHNPISTGYYAMDNAAAQYGAPWQPTYTFLDISGSLASSWRRIASGPFQNSPIPFTPAPAGPFGVEYFRNPQMVLPSFGAPCPVTGGGAAGYDSTDDAFAGPLSIGFPFYYYGVKYDSFYVSTNGLIMLSNRRYKYDALGNRADYEPFGDNPQRPLWTNLPGVNPTPSQQAILAQDVNDDYGYMNALTMLSGPPGTSPSASNQNFPANGVVGIPTTLVGVNTSVTSAQPNFILPNGAMSTDRGSWRSVIAPLWDDCELPQVTPDVSGNKPPCGTGIGEDIGKVYWRIDPTGNQMTIYFKNLAMASRVKKHAFLCRTVTPGYNVIKSDFQVTFDRYDSTVTFNYISFTGTVARFPPPPASAMFRANATIGLQGSDLINNDNGIQNTTTGTIGTGNNFGSVKNGFTVAAGNSRQFTRYTFNDCPNGGGVYVDGDIGSTPSAGMALKFKQWKNVARILDVKYNVPDYTLCDPRVPTTVQPPPNTFNIAAPTFNFELLLGHPVLGVLQPQGVVQNLTADTRLGNLFFQNPNISPVGIGTTWNAWNAINNPANPTYSSNSLGNLAFWVNNQEQPVSFEVTFRITDLVTFGNIPYQNSARTLSLYPISYNSANAGPPYVAGNTPNFQVMVFPPYITNQTLANQLGRFKAEMFVSDISPLGARYGEQWPFDDTSSQLLFGIRREEIPYINTFSDYSNSFLEGPIPNVKKWVTIGAGISDGEANTYDPPSPRGPQGDLNINSPLVRMDGRDFNGTGYSSTRIGWGQSGATPPNLVTSQQPPQSSYPSPGIGGDLLISFPINISSVTSRPVINLSYQRSGVNNYPRGWSDASRIGTDALTTQPDRNNNWTFQISFINYVVGCPDNLVVDFARPSNNGCNRMTNIGLKYPGVSRAPYENGSANGGDWYALAYSATGAPFGDLANGSVTSYTPRVVKWPAANYLNQGASTIPYTLFPTGTQVATPYPRWGVLGGNGGSGLDTAGKIILNELDPGKDFEFTRVMIPIPSAHYQEFSWAAIYQLAPNPIYDGNSAKFFRFRVRAAVRNHAWSVTPAGLPPGNIADDDDPFFVDNINLTEPLYPEIEVVKVKVDWPFTEAPASQAKQVPLSAKVFNNGSSASTAFGMAVFVENLDAPPAPGNYSYYRYKSVIALPAGQERFENYPAWNAQECGAKITPANPNQSISTNYRISAKVSDSYEANFSSSLANCDYCKQNNLQYTDFALRLGPTYAYDPASSPTGTNDVPTFATYTGKGLNTMGTPEDGQNESPFGSAGGQQIPTARLGSGAFAMNFPIFVTDTLKGYTALFGSMNQSPDQISYLVYRNNPGSAPSVPITGSRRYAKRGEGFRMSGAPSDPLYPYAFDEYVTFLLDTPLVLTPGNYYVAVEQLGEDGIELGGSAYHMGQVITLAQAPPSAGVGNVSPAIYRDLGGAEKFWWENNAGASGTWLPFMRDRGNPGYAHFNWAGFQGEVTLLGSTGIGSGTNFSRGSWIPMLRPYFGSKNANDCTVLPVEMTEFNLTELSDAIRLDWRTSSETNNYGYNVERRVKGSDAWSNVPSGFVKGNGTTNVPQNYNFTDANVERDLTYQYRLRQEDIDGSKNYSAVREGRIESVRAGELSMLEQNTPNPMSNQTAFGVNVKTAGIYNIEISDIYGKTVRSLSFNAESGKRTSVNWDGKDENGTTVSAGNYIYKLVGNGLPVVSRKLTIVK
ncbi:MAG: hypothetical protein IPP65_05775 [Chlorobi bacterium]|nr:hypothetical protein [Chlorobiota bacterium]